MRSPDNVLVRFAGAEQEQPEEHLVSDSCNRDNVPDRSSDDPGKNFSTPISSSIIAKSIVECRKLRHQLLTKSSSILPEVLELLLFLFILINSISSSICI